MSSFLLYPEGIPDASLRPSCHHRQRPSALWIPVPLVRESGTEPLVRVMVEAGEEALCEKYVDEVIDVIVKKGYRED